MCRCSTAARRPVREVCSPAFCSVDVEPVWDLVQDWRVEQIRPSRGGFSRRRRVWFQGRRSLGRVPDRWIFGVAFISFMASVFCGSYRSHTVMELLLTWGWWQWLPVNWWRSCLGVSFSLPFIFFIEYCCKIYHWITILPINIYYYNYFCIADTHLFLTESLGCGASNLTLLHYL